MTHIPVSRANFYYFVSSKTLNILIINGNKLILANIHTEKSMSLWEQDVHPIQFGFMCKFLIFLELEPFSTIMCPPSTESEYQKWQYNYIGQYSSRKVKGSMESGCPSYPVRKKKNVNLSYFWS